MPLRRGATNTNDLAIDGAASVARDCLRSAISLCARYSLRAMNVRASRATAPLGSRDAVPTLHSSASTRDQLVTARLPPGDPRVDRENFARFPARHATCVGARA